MTPKKEYDKEREYDYRKYTIHCYPVPYPVPQRTLPVRYNETAPGCYAGFPVLMDLYNVHSPVSWGAANYVQAFLKSGESNDQGKQDG